MVKVLAADPRVDINVCSKFYVSQEKGHEHLSPLYLAFSDFKSRIAKILLKNCADHNIKILLLPTNMKFSSKPPSLC